MLFKKMLIASATLVAAMGAQAQVAGSLGGGTGSFLTLSSAGLAGGSVATLSGGAVYNADMPFADIPKGGVYGGDFLAAGPSSGNNSATLSFVGGGVSYVSFLWGSPDTYNQLTVDTTQGNLSFTASSLGFSVTNGNQAFSQYVQFSALGSAMITGLVFTNAPAIDAFETANFSVTPVPEPGTYALMIAGLGVVGFVAARRKRQP